MTFDQWLQETLDRLDVGPKQLAEALDVSLSRVYQIRSQATATPYLAWRLERAFPGVRVPEQLVRRSA